MNANLFPQVKPFVTEANLRSAATYPELNLKSGLPPLSGARRACHNTIPALDHGGRFSESRGPDGVKRLDVVVEPPAGPVTVVKDERAVELSWNLLYLVIGYEVRPFRGAEGLEAVVEPIYAHLMVRDTARPGGAGWLPIQAWDRWSEVPKAFRALDPKPAASDLGYAAQDLLELLFQEDEA